MKANRKSNLSIPSSLLLDCFSPHFVNIDTNGAIAAWGGDEEIDLIISEEGSICSAACFHIQRGMEMFTITAINFPI